MNKGDNKFDIEIDVSIDAHVPLIIAFSGRGDYYGGSPQYEFKNFLKKHFKCNCIFVKDRFKNWYANGIYGMGLNIDDSICYLRRILFYIKYSKIITIGHSAGGYASIVFGNLLNVDGILSICPQTNVPTNSKHADIAEMEKNNKSKIIVIYGDHEPDAISALRLSHLPETTLIYHEGDHMLVRELRDNGKLCEFITKLL